MHEKFYPKKPRSLNESIWFTFPKHNKTKQKHHFHKIDSFNTEQDPGRIQTFACEISKMFPLQNLKTT